MRWPWQRSTPYSIAALVYFAAHGNIAALWSKDFISTLPLLAGVALPYALLYGATRLANKPLSRWTGSLANAIAIVLAAWGYAYVFMDADREIGVMFAAVPLLQCMLATITGLLALWLRSDAARNGAI